jgi:hypothetical protein
VTARLKRAAGEAQYSQAVTDASGAAELTLNVTEHAFADSHILVQATHGGRIATRKFRLRKTARA